MQRRGDAMNEQIKLLIVDDHPSWRRGIINYIKTYGPKFDIVGETGGISEALEMFSILKPDVVVTDLVFPGQGRDGVELIKEMKQWDPNARIIMTTSKEHVHFMVRAYRAGAIGWIYKESECVEYITSIERAFEGTLYFPSELLELMRPTSEVYLTPREIELMPLIAEGLSSKQIATVLNRRAGQESVKSTTIDIHKGNIKRKYGIDSPGELVACAVWYCEENNIEFRKPWMESLPSCWCEA
jgi:DNA-binding NarL/FixJ family response regulator